MLYIYDVATMHVCIYLGVSYTSGTAYTGSPMPQSVRRLSGEVSMPPSCAGALRWWWEGISEADWAGEGKMGWNGFLG